MIQRLHQSSQEVVFCSNLDLIIKQVLQDPLELSSPGPVRFEDLLNGLLVLVSLRVSSGQQLQRL